MHKSALSALFALLALSAGATASSEPEIEVSGAWVRWLPGGAPMGGYFELRNDGPETLALTGASSPAFGSVSLHETVSISDGMTSMRPLPLPLEVPPGGQVEFEPGGYHLMLREPQRSIKPGDEVTITFEGGADVRIPVTFDVRSITGE